MDISRDILDEDEEEDEEEGDDELSPKWDSSSFFKRHALDRVTLEEKDGNKEIVYVDPPNNWVVVDRMIDDISKRHDMDKPSSVLFLMVECSIRL